MIGKSFKDCKLDKVGTIYADWQEGAFRCLVVRGPSSLHAYIGVTKGNPLYGKSYWDLESEIDCHGGLTFGREGGGDDELRPAGYWWLGWDYGHCDDAPFYDAYSIADEHRWTPDEVVAEFPAVIEQFEELSKVKPERPFTFGMKGKHIARLDVGGHTTWCSGDTEQQAIKNVLNACRIGSLDDEWFMAFCSRYTDAVMVQEVKE